jgi:ABC-2 type transport system ATP-binding protein
VDFRLLGPVEASANGRPLPLGPRQQRLVLAVLALGVTKVVPVEQLVDLVWPDLPPRTAVHAIQVFVSRLRSVLDAAPERSPPGAGSTCCPPMTRCASSRS